jgi:serine/threonine-protein kinase
MDPRQDKPNDPAAGTVPTDTVPTDTRSFPEPSQSDRPTSPFPAAPDQTTSSPDQTPTPLFPQIPGYSTDHFLGEGGMGQVYRAEDRVHRRTVAIKFLKRGKDASPSEVIRFRKEAAALQRLDHPNVVRVYETGEAGGFAYYVMRYVPTGSLVRQSDQVRTSARRVAEFTRAVAGAVDYLHRSGVLHRDLKPGNILVDEHGQPLLVDFGLARVDDGHTPTVGGGLFGTPAYMAPEVLRGGAPACDERTDVWSVGVVLYELLAGRRPFVGQLHNAARDFALHRTIQFASPPPVREGDTALQDTDDRLETICLKCLAKNPDRRYQTAGELAADLDRWLAGRPLAYADPTDTRSAAEAPPPVETAAPTTVANTTVTAPGQRKWAGALMVLLGAVVILGVTLAALFWRRPTLAERLPEPDVSVEFVGETGLPAEQVGPLGAFVGTQSVGEEGRLELGAGKMAFLVLFRERFPFPVRFEAEVRIATPMKDTEAGIFALEKRHEFENGKPVHLAFVNAFAVGKRNPKNRRELLHNRTAADVFRFGAPDGTPDANEFTAFVPCLDRWRESTPADAVHPHDKPGPPHRLTIDVYPNELSATRDGGPCGRLTLPSPRLDWQLEFDGIRADPPPLGDGYGLFVTYGAAQFSNVKVTRLPAR